ncbi:DEAD/DEAH box helicase family protein [Solitalea canadensis]|uniref:Adenylate kinase n=1 Tax=Solitalea canadensis (strain ATCC 29591 / DSM 3403 / JCM 21819 / LMG 8368 / NBRC 15130 / NCIMB 12057 / USAM 9D) TaxID=929556 RepID=H8KPT9_SOLCM|nr:hypothetical protein [Solitalea canadensis]AFD05987.1 hypothetical protein Solca_0872 [Solitalea canadensis DSM 3403]
MKHVLIIGPAGSGKTRLSKLLAKGKMATFLGMKVCPKFNLTDALFHSQIEKDTKTILVEDASAYAINEVLTLIKVGVRVDQLFKGTVQLNPIFIINTGISLTELSIDVLKTFTIIDLNGPNTSIQIYIDFSKTIKEVQS